MKIVNVCRRFDPGHWGGTETVVAETGTRLAARGHHVSVLASSALGRVGRIRLRGLPIERFAYHYPYLFLKPPARAAMDNAGGNLISWPLLGRLLTMPRPDVVHLHTGGRLGAMVRWACRRRGIPYLVSLHGGRFAIPPTQRQIFQKPLQGTLDLGKPLGLAFGSRRVLRDAERVLAFSRQEALACRRADPSLRVTQLPHGLDLAAWQAALPGEAHTGLFRRGAHPRLLCVGRLDPQKGQDILLEAARTLLAPFPDLELLLIGSQSEPGYAERLMRQIHEAGLQGHVRTLGGLDPLDPRLKAAYRSADCLVIPSRHEPFGIVALEGWASGVPVVGSRVGGLADLLDSPAGRLVPPSDPRALADSLRELILDPAARETMQTAGLTRVADHDWNRVVDRLEGLMRSATQRRAQPALGRAG